VTVTSNCSLIWWTCWSDDSNYYSSKYIHALSIVHKHSIYIYYMVLSNLLWTLWVLSGYIAGVMPCYTNAQTCRHTLLMNAERIVLINVKNCILYICCRYRLLNTAVPGARWSSSCLCMWVDMALYVVGIGYFTLPYLGHTGAAHVYACEWIRPCML